MLTGPTMERWIETFIQQKVYATLRQEKSLADILPESLQRLILQTIDEQTPALLSNLATILKEPGIRDKIVTGVRAGVENFINSMGPMAGMVKTFLNMETVEKKVREYLMEKEDEITDWLQRGEVRERVAAALRERSRSFLSTPIVSMIKEGQEEAVEHFCSQVSLQIAAILRDPETSATLSSMIRDNLETYMEEGGLSIGEVLWDVAGEDGMERSKAWIRKKVVDILRSEESRKKINVMAQTLLNDLLGRSIGRLSALLPVGIRDGIYRSIQKMTSDMLAAEVPGLVTSLNLRQIVKEKVDSLDLMRLERLLLGIMEEQFKYINLFGAILGFLIGGLNVLLMVAS
jgi:uncharacterized membrane protein YheB (UPF0754 family)